METDSLTARPSPHTGRVAIVLLAALAALSSACSDDPNPSTAPCSPGATQACLCAAGDDGVQACVDDGSRWDACDCGGATVGCDTADAASCPEGVCVDGQCVHEEGDSISDAMEEEVRAAIEEAEASRQWPDGGGPLQHRLPFEPGVHMGISQGTNCGGHAQLKGSVDFNVLGPVESGLGLKAVTSQVGTVVKVVSSVTGYVAGTYGNYVIVRHPGGEYSLYAHLAAGSVLVDEGDEVCQGQALGVIGSTGESSGDHLHYERRDANQQRLIPSFEELEVVPSSCNPCVTSSQDSGCYESRNSLLCPQELPEPPQLLAPDDGARFESGDSIRFRFTRSGAGEHFLKIRLDPPNGPVVHDAAVAGTEEVVDALAPGTYRWTVYIADEGCIDGECAAPAREFTIAPLTAGCASDNDCPADTLGAWQACGTFSGECGESGTRTRTVTHYTCGADGMCSSSNSTGEEACSRSTSGGNCAGGTCQAGSCQATTTCHVEVSPAINAWTPDFTPQTDCTCSGTATDCHTLYEGRATAVNGHQATLQFHKTPDNGGPSASVSYWVVVGAATTPSCVDLTAFISRTSGTWPVNSGDLTVTQVNVWPTAEALAEAPAGDQKKLFVITGGGGGLEGDRVWFQKQAIVFTKVCD